MFIRMGILCSKNKDVENQIQKQFEERLKRLEEQVDANNDGIISRNEMETFLSSRLQFHDNELNSVKTELGKYKQAYENIKLQHDALKEQIRENNPTEMSISNVSDVLLDRYIVEQMKKSNIPYILDPIEKEMKKLPIKIMLESLESLSNNLTFDFANHRVKLIIEPILEN